MSEHRRKLPSDDQVDGPKVESRGRHRGVADTGRMAVSGAAAGERTEQHARALEAMFEAGRQTVRIAHSFPGGKVYTANGEERRSGGYNSFGAGAHGNPNTSRWWERTLDDVADSRSKGPAADRLSAEMVVIEPVVEHKPITIQEVVPGTWRTKATTKTRRTLSNQATPVMTENLVTGETEQLVTVAYSFGSNRKAEPQAYDLGYNDDMHRRGNKLVAEMDVPASVASAFVTTLQEKPDTAREWAEMMFLQSVPPDTASKIWIDRPEPFAYSAKPPYENLAPDSQLSIVAMDPLAATASWITNIPMNPQL